MFIKAYYNCNTSGSSVALVDPVFIKKVSVQTICPHQSVRNVYQVITQPGNNIYYLKLSEMEEVPFEEAVNHLALVETLTR